MLLLTRRRRGEREELMFHRRPFFFLPHSTAVEVEVEVSTSKSMPRPIGFRKESNPRLLVRSNCWLPICVDCGRTVGSRTKYEEKERQRKPIFVVVHTGTDTWTTRKSLLGWPKCQLQRCQMPNAKWQMPNWQKCTTAFFNFSVTVNEI